jgi:hypothetical protein
MNPCSLQLISFRAALGVGASAPEASPLYFPYNFKISYKTFFQNVDSRLAVNASFRALHRKK